jgi:hypothetical protein
MEKIYPLSPEAFKIFLRQKNRIVRSSLFAAGRSTERFRHYSIGLMSRHRKGILAEIKRICAMYPWALRRGGVELSDAVISSVQSEMILCAARFLYEKKKFPAFIPISFYADEKSVVIVLECFLGFFEHYGFTPRLKAEHYSKAFYSRMDSSSLVLKDFVSADERFEISGQTIDGLRVPVSDETSNVWIRTDSFSGKDGILWKRVSACIENG